jgi:hypothetical protein
MLNNKEVYFLNNCNWLKVKIFNIRSLEMQFKYHDYICEFKECPPKAYESRNLTGFRFVFHDLDCSNNYLPPLAINPKRINTPQFQKVDRKCQGYALSMFDSAENAKLRYIKLLKNIGNISKALGTHVAEFNITEFDGVVSENNQEGHFDLHEFQNISFIGRIRIISEAI